MNTILRQYAQAYASLSGYTVDFNPKTVTMFNSVLNQTFLVVISATEPTGTLPLNVIWLVMDKLSDKYQQFMIRTSKTAIAPYLNTWSAMTEIAQLYIPQYYDVEDNALYSGKLLDATSEVAGVAKLTYVSSTPLTPVFVAETDTRLTDSRNPKAHSHAEKAMRLVKTLNASVDLTVTTTTDDATAIVADSATSATQRHLRKNEVL
jgi:hypothetical protein